MDTRSEGAWAERAVGRRLIRDGWQIVGRDERIGGVQIDLVARRRARVVLWEVKRRRSGVFPPVGAAQRDRLMAAAGAWAGRAAAGEVGVGLAIVSGRRWWPRIDLDDGFGAAGTYPESPSSENNANSV